MLANNPDVARHNMVLQQIRPCEVIDERVLHVVDSIPREDFVPQDYSGLAFADIEIPLGDGQSMMKPKVEAQMLQALAVHPHDKILEIGTGSGFVTACLARLGDSVSSWDIREGLTQEAAKRLEAHDIRNVDLQTGDALNADLPAGGYDVIAVTGSLPEYDDRLEQLLAPGGRLYLVTGESPVMSVMLTTCVGDGLFRRESLSETDLPALDNSAQKEQFIF